MMEMTLNVKISGIENLVAVLERFAAVSQVGALAMPAPEVQPVPVNASPVAAVIPPAAPAIIPTAVPVAQPATVTPVAPVAAAPATVVPTAPQSYTQEQLALAASQLMDAGRIAEVQALVAAFNVQSLTALPPEQYGNFATHLRALGAKI